MTMNTSRLMVTIVRYSGMWFRRWNSGTDLGWSGRASTMKHAVISSLSAIGSRNAPMWELWL